VRPFWGHDSHFHIRIGCQPGSSGCTGQAATAPGDGCDKSLAWWFTEEPWRPNKNPDAPKARDLMTMKSLPRECRAVLEAPAPVSEAAVTIGGSGTAVAAARTETLTIEDIAGAPPIAASAFAPTPDLGVPLPRPRPAD
jgi:penicillin-insensitive murein endopeptidase